ncbi:MAG TPA: cysteine dioxygenase family protein [Polyangiales bacterium]|jgi:predicted metal-dependent enzyme (double-stranded beta helix superfamily)
MIHVLNTMPALARARTRTSAPLRSARIELERWLARIRFDDLGGIDDLRDPSGDARRSYLRLPTRADCEAWLICWPIGSSAPLHDHGGADGVAAVLTGQLHERRYLASAQRWIEQAWKPGAIIELAVPTCHAVHNLEPRVSYSIHVYAPRLDSMTFYEQNAEGGIERVRQEARSEW